MRVPDGAIVTVHQVRVGYIDTDQGRVVHHGTYLRYLEHARVEHLRARGLDYRSFELDQKLGLPVVEANLRYRMAAHFDDVLDIKIWISLANRAKVRFDSMIFCDHRLLTTAEITLACIRLPEGKICSMPDSVLRLVQP